MNGELSGKSERELPDACSPLADWIAYAIRRSERACARNGKKKGWKRMFEFARIAKGIPELSSLDASAALARIEHSLKVLDPCGADVWQRRFPESDDPRMEFLDSWDKVKSAGDKAYLDKILIRSLRYPLHLELPRSKKYFQFVAFAYALQLDKSGEVIKLPVERMGEMFDCEPRTISNYRDRAQKDGFLSKVEEANHAKGEAAGFHFNLNAIDAEARTEKSSEKGSRSGIATDIPPADDRWNSKPDHGFFGPFDDVPRWRK